MFRKRKRRHKSRRLSRTTEKTETTTRRKTMERKVLKKNLGSHAGNVMKIRRRRKNANKKSKKKHGKEGSIKFQRLKRNEKSKLQQENGNRSHSICIPINHEVYFRRIHLVSALQGISIKPCSFLFNLPS